MSNKIDDEKLRAAREKLACHIEPPKGSAYAEALARANADNAQHAEAPASVSPSAADTCSTDAGSCGAPGELPPAGQKIRLTEMTSAGG